MELRSLRFVVAVCGAVEALELELGVVDIEAVGADHAGFEGVDEDFQEGEAGRNEGEGDDALAEESGDPEVVD